ncbi:hypothetical protein [Cellulomonas marina]|uniref:Nucleotidyltransferase domain-containing protein n=1 Tax=Cellulomonas marina TaxID=988821 RepID=A0A1I0VCW9_9CELL|nr:hypothetical protein [Cellulomonas marina]GIG28038.1 hypothetical protein Cma02nite_06380 [Cellulomonas marina]SFA74204.1 hypothetical protein SAMN05421867_101323 [Cellulomonas marina]
MTSPQPHPPVTPQRLLDRLDDIGRRLARTPGALALLGLGSVGTDRHRLDEHSDLDFFVVVEDGAEPRFLEQLDWLEGAAPLAFSFANTADGRKALFEDGVYAEYAVFTVAALRSAAYPPARVVWRRPDAPEGLEVPARPLPRDGGDVAHQVSEALTNLLVGLHRDLRGERLAATRLVQVHAVDRVLRLAELAAEERGERGARQDAFAAERGVERAYPSLPLAAMVPGYDRNGPAARAVLDHVARHHREHVDPALRRAVEGLVAAVEEREAADAARATRSS